MVKVKTDVLKVKVVREIKSNFKSYLSVILIAALAVTLFTGIWANYRDFQDKLNEIYTVSSMCDGMITMNSADEDVENFLKEKSVTYQKRIFATAKVDGKSVYIATFSADDKLDLPYSSSVKVNEYGVYADENFAKNHKCGEDFSVTTDISLAENVTLNLTGTIVHPESLGNSVYNPSFIYVGKKALVKSLAISLDKYKTLFGYTDEAFEKFIEGYLADYENQYLIKSADATSLIDEAKTKFSGKESFVYALKRSNLPTNVTIEADVTQAKQLLYIFPVIFYLVALLIILTSVSQLINREQKNIGILKALGYSKIEILWHYTDVFHRSRAYRLGNGDSARPRDNPESNGREIRHTLSVAENQNGVFQVGISREPCDSGRNHSSDERFRLSGFDKQSSRGEFARR